MIDSPSTVQALAPPTQLSGGPDHGDPDSSGMGAVRADAPSRGAEALSEPVQALPAQRESQPAPVSASPAQQGRLPPPVLASPRQQDAQDETRSPGSLQSQQGSPVRQAAAGSAWPVSPAGDAVQGSTGSGNAGSTGGGGQQQDGGNGSYDSYFDYAYDTWDSNEMQLQQGGATQQAQRSGGTGGSDAGRWDTAAPVKSPPLLQPGHKQTQQPRVRDAASWRAPAMYGMGRKGPLASGGWVLHTVVGAILLTAVAAALYCRSVRRQAPANPQERVGLMAAQL